jgi:hypothetical protein
MAGVGVADGRAKVSSGERVDVGDGGRPERLLRGLERRAECGPRPVIGQQLAWEQGVSGDGLVDGLGGGRERSQSSRAGGRIAGGVVDRVSYCHDPGAVVLSEGV